MTPQQTQWYRTLRGWPRFLPARFAWEQAKRAWFVSRREFYQRVKLG